MWSSGRSKLKRIRRSANRGADASARHANTGCPGFLSADPPTGARKKSKSVVGPDGIGTDGGVADGGNKDPAPPAKVSADGTNDDAMEVDAIVAAVGVRFLGQMARAIKTIEAERDPVDVATEAERRDALVRQIEVTTERVERDEMMTAEEKRATASAHFTALVESNPNVRAMMATSAVPSKAAPSKAAAAWPPVLPPTYASSTSSGMVPAALPTQQVFRHFDIKIGQGGTHPSVVPKMSSSMIPSCPRLPASSTTMIPSLGLHHLNSDQRRWSSTGNVPSCVQKKLEDEAAMYEKENERAAIEEGGRHGTLTAYNHPMRGSGQGVMKALLAHPQCGRSIAGCLTGMDAVQMLRACKWDALGVQVLDNVIDSTAIREMKTKAAKDAIAATDILTEVQHQTKETAAFLENIMAQIRPTVTSSDGDSDDDSDDDDGGYGFGNCDDDEDSGAVPPSPPSSPPPSHSRRALGDLTNSSTKPPKAAARRRTADSEISNQDAIINGKRERRTRYSNSFDDDVLAEHGYYDPSQPELKESAGKAVDDYDSDDEEDHYSDEEANLNFDDEEEYHSDEEFDANADAVANFDAPMSTRKVESSKYYLTEDGKRVDVPSCSQRKSDNLRTVNLRSLIPDRGNFGDGTVVAETDIDTTRFELPVIQAAHDMANRGVISLQRAKSGHDYLFSDLVLGGRVDPIIEENKDVAGPLLALSCCLRAIGVLKARLQIYFGEGRTDIHHDHPFATVRLLIKLSGTIKWYKSTSKIDPVLHDSVGDDEARVVSLVCGGAESFAMGRLYYGAPPTNVNPHSSEPRSDGEPSVSIICQLPSGTDKDEATEKVLKMLTTLFDETTLTTRPEFKRQSRDGGAPSQYFQSSRGSL